MGVPFYGDPAAAFAAEPPVICVVIWGYTRGRGKNDQKIWIVKDQPLLSIIKSAIVNNCQQSTFINCWIHGEWMLMIRTNIQRSTTTHYYPWGTIMGWRAATLFRRLCYSMGIPDSRNPKLQPLQRFQGHFISWASNSQWLLKNKLWWTWPLRMLYNSCFMFFSPRCCCWCLASEVWKGEQWLWLLLVLWLAQFVVVVVDCRLFVPVGSKVVHNAWISYPQDVSIS